jgi:hypothetical protein
LAGLRYSAARVALPSFSKRSAQYSPKLPRGIEYFPFGALSSGWMRMKLPRMLAVLEGPHSALLVLSVVDITLQEPGSRSGLLLPMATQRSP